MEVPGIDLEQDRHAEVVVSQPVTELLQNPAEAARLWPEHDLTDQLEQHSSDIATVFEVTDSLPSPTVSLQDALLHGHVSDEQVTRLYSVLSNTLDNPDYERLALYLPFEFLPDATWQPDNFALQGSIDHFITSYRRAWSNLLNMHEVRANYVDGDIHEAHYESGNYPRIVKAAHLIPDLLTKGMISEDYVDQLLKTPDPVLRQSINEALGEMYGVQPALPAAADKPEVAISESRHAWLEQVRQEEFIQKVGEIVALSLVKKETKKDIVGILLNMPDPSSSSQAYAEGVYKAIQRSTREETKSILEQQMPNLEALWESADPEIEDRIASVFRRLHRAGKLPHDELARLGISLPLLEGPFSENLSEIAADVAFLKEIAQTLETHPTLSSVVYPIITVGGSKLKGYGRLNSDVDVSLFIKPNTLPGAKKYIAEELDKLLVRDGIQYKPIECWLEETADGKLVINSPKTPDLHAADSYWTHILFGTAWVGNEKVIKEIQQKLLPRYFQPTTETVHGINKRLLYLERLEQDLLQYRLMHKGYERHYPLAETGKTVDKSVFWDPGYRQLATKLFISQVFLPKIK